jgi:hypothetical protein
VKRTLPRRQLADHAREGDAVARHQVRRREAILDQVVAIDERIAELGEDLRELSAARGRGPAESDPPRAARTCGR